MANIIKLPQYVWYESREVEFALPDNWEVNIHNIAGYDKPAMTPEEIEAAISSPTGMPQLREYARGRKEAVIIFDDMTRSTMSAQIIPFILNELAEAGFTDDRIRFIAAVANHHALDWISMARKVGEDIVARFPVYNHCPFLNCTDIGTSSYGTAVSVNSEVMYCDLKIGIGSVVPHPIYGLSGGGKIIMPGVSSYQSVLNHHGRTHQAWREERRNRGLPLSGELNDNPLQLDAQEIAGMAGLDMVINCFINRWGETVKIMAGALDPTYQAAVKEARSHYVAANTKDNDIVIANNLTKATEFVVSLVPAVQAVKPEGGSIVINSNPPSGQVVHYLYDNFGKTIGGDLFNRIVIAPHIKNVIIYTEYPEARTLGRFENPDQVLQTNDWDRVIETLVKTHGHSAKVAVYPNSDTQYYAD